MSTSTASSTADREVVIERTVSAPRELVWEVWTKPEHVARWWGPDGFSITTHEMDVRVGGMWRYIMHFADGTDFDNYTKYSEVAPPERLVYEHGEKVGEPWFHTTVTFTESEGGTAIRMQLVFPTKEARDEVVEKYSAIEGGNQTLSKLDNYLKQVQSEGMQQ